MKFKVKLVIHTESCHSFRDKLKKKVYHINEKYATFNETERIGDFYFLPMLNPPILICWDVAN